jgi:hypothetical protein
MYGEAYIQVPNKIFKNISSVTNDSRQNSFCFSYITLLGFLYKYTAYVNPNLNTYVQAKDIKTLLGYSEKTKTINRLIKENGILEDKGFIKTTKKIPVYVSYSDDEINGYKIIEFTTLDNIKNREEYDMFKKIIKNRNYKIQEPIYLFNVDGKHGTLYDYSNTFKINISEFIKFIENKEMGNMDIMFYYYIKSQTQNKNHRVAPISISLLEKNIGFSNSSIYKTITKLEKLNLISVTKKGWQNIKDGNNPEPNDFFLSYFLSR